MKMAHVGHTKRVDGLRKKGGIKSLFSLISFKNNKKIKLKTLKIKQIFKLSPITQ